MSEKFTIREATDDDIPIMVDFLVDLGLHVSGAERQTLKQEANERLQLFLKDYIDDTEKLLLVACTSSGEAVGMGNIQIWHSPNLWEEAEDLNLKTGFIDDLWVEPAYRGQGIMPQLLEELLEFADQHEIEELVLEYAITNKEAANAWKRLGFSPTGVRAAASTSLVRQKLARA